MNLLGADDMGSTIWATSAEETPREVALTVDDLQRFAEPYFSLS